MFSGHQISERARRSARSRIVVRFWLPLLFILGLTTGCQADFAVEIQVEEDGSGVVNTEVVLDQEAADALLDLGPGQTLPLADLAQALGKIDTRLRRAKSEARLTVSAVKRAVNRRR